MEGGPLYSEKLSIKNLLFTKAIPNYTIPVPTDGRQIFSCKDCGDKYLIKSSYEYHINRKSIKITYGCRYCNKEKIFYNRCNLLSHIRSHVFKTATINISDLKIEPLPLTFYNFQNVRNNETQMPWEVPSCSQVGQSDTEIQNREQPSTNIICFDCKKDIFSSGILYKDRAKHYSQFTRILYSCPICLLTLPTQCALKVHLRIHLREPPFFCPECGFNLSDKALVYPFTHDCESFKRMRVTTKLKCTNKNCNHIFHPNNVLNHLKNFHLKKVYKCSNCSVACYKINNMLKHVKSHKKRINILEFFQCEICPGRLVIPGQIERHLRGHEHTTINEVYPCWTCGATFELAKSLVIHQIYKHKDTDLKEIFGNIAQEHSGTDTEQHQKTTSKFLVNEKCHKCFRNFISRRPSNDNTVSTKDFQCECRKVTDSTDIVCHLCKLSMKLDWNIIKKHYATLHKEHICLDAKIVVDKLINVNKYKKNVIGVKKPKKIIQIEKKCCNATNKDMSDTGNHETVSNANNNGTVSNNNLICRKCGKQYENKQLLEKHIVTHKDPFMAYQCMDCGESFVSKTSFATHLLLKHGINDVNDYIDQKNCYSKESLHISQKMNVEDNEPVKENQCNICREQFNNSTDFEKHFRVHGMAFLMKNKSTSPDKV